MQFKSFGTETSAVIRPPASIAFLLAFLAVTVRFHPGVAAHHSSSTPDRSPFAASEFYASAASAQLTHQMSALGNGPVVYDLETTQAMLMLTLHEWSMNRGIKAWAHLKNAITSAQAMGLHIEQDLDDKPFARCFATASAGEDSISDIDRRSSSIGSSNDAFIQQEIRRRTFWTCFILDRYLSNGKFRPQVLRVKDMRIQLPASEQAFLFGEKVRTLMLGEEERDVALRIDEQSRRRSSIAIDSINGGAKRQSFASNESNGGNASLDQGKWEVGADEGLVSRYIKIMDIYGRVLRWACGGGRQ